MLTIQSDKVANEQHRVQRLPSVDTQGRSVGQKTLRGCFRQLRKNSNKLHHTERDGGAAVGQLLSPSKNSPLDRKSAQRLLHKVNIHGPENRLRPRLRLPPVPLARLAPPLSRAKLSALTRPHPSARACVRTGLRRPVSCVGHLLPASSAALFAFL